MTASVPKPVPEGWAPFQRSSPFVNLLGGLWVREGGPERLLGLRVEERHLNTRGTGHGGVLVTLADAALGIAIPRSIEPRRPVVTVSLSVDFLTPVSLGCWLEARVDVERAGKRLAFATCHVETGGRLVLRASGVFAFVHGAEADG